MEIDKRLRDLRRQGRRAKRRTTKTIGPKNREEEKTDAEDH